MRVDNLNKHATVKQVKKRLESNLGVKGIRQVKKIGQDFGFVHFVDAESRSAAEALMEGHAWNGRTLKLRHATPLDPHRFKRQRQDSSDAGAVVEAPENAADVVTSLHRMEYGEQLVQKRRSLAEVLKTLPPAMNAASKGIDKAQLAQWHAIPWLDLTLTRTLTPTLTQAQLAARHAIPWLDLQRVASNGGLPCTLAEVLRAPRTHGYRNKCEFSFGRDPPRRAMPRLPAGPDPARRCRDRPALRVPERLRRDEGGRAPRAGRRRDLAAAAVRQDERRGLLAAADGAPGLQRPAGAARRRRRRAAPRLPRQEPRRG